ncbi:serine hydrolase [Planomicrobium sp. CPCC 101079]|uniref:serine hydrolase domain-containing protein n=1 Tax=Planomicrobium sp. CPCC 101079 TaxID=2599618 RepID=UPI0011B608D7|nr:serine hydrolase domain-containing protein [Planomicrobium sp. CPCC 101079]TWT00148.1 beta-lactamase family protein [Planomicrobium sp. CPCC 101079]
MLLKTKLNSQFDSVVTHVRDTSKLVDCSGAAVVIIQNDAIIVEEYWGKQTKADGASPVQEDTQFHVASVRKSYIGFAMAYAVEKGDINSVDDLVSSYLPELDVNVLAHTTLRHLLTHTHGLTNKEGELEREFPPGQSWAYRGIGIDMLTQIVKKTTGKTVAAILEEQVFIPLKFKETGWYGESNEKLVEVIRKPLDRSWYTSESTDGDKMNMYVSARELAQWGLFHLKQGKMEGKQVVSSDVLSLATSLQSPDTINPDLPQNGFLWFVKDLPARKSEIGEQVPRGSYQILGYTGVTLLVIPQHNIVAVRAFNSFGSPEGFDYLSDVRAFGDYIMQCL